MSAGIQSQISFKKETTWGTAVVPDKSVPVRPTGGIQIKENVQMIPAVHGSLQKNMYAVKGKVGYEGDYTMDAFADYTGFFLLSALGTDTPVLHSGETIVYDHVFTETIPKPSFTIEQAIINNVRRFAGCICTGFKLSGKPGEILEFTPSFLGKTQASATQITGAFTTVPAFDHGQIIVKIGGTTIGEVENIELEYKSGEEMVYALGNYEPSFHNIQGGSTITGKMDVYLDSTSAAELANYISKTARSIELVATGSGVIGSAANYVLDILIPQAFYTMIDSKITDAHNVITISFEGVFDLTSGKLVAVTLTNLLATY